MPPRPAANLKITSEEIANINRFRQLKDTSVLTIMFTDIKGFTQMTEEKGEHYSSKIREKHDAILVEAIEENNGGLVVKHIGDAIMAVFSEPSTAVARALKIQDALLKFNAEHPELEDIVVRIGLDMGQVAVENEVQPDMFGRHVNRASRVEGLADGGQIYMTFPVFDSAKGWLTAQVKDRVSWHCHGHYYLKGIPAAIEIYEVMNPTHASPRAPKKGKKKTAMPKWTVSIALLVVGAGVALGILQIKRTQVWFVDMHAEKPFIDYDTRLILDGSQDQKTRRALVKIPMGRHVLHYDVNFRVKYFADIDVKRGKNYITAKFKECGLPSLSRHLTLRKENNYIGEKDAERSFEYSFYTHQGEKKTHKATIQLSVKGAQAAEKKNHLKFILAWKLTVDDKVVSEEKKEYFQDLANMQRQDGRFILFEDETHYYYAKFYIIRNSVQLDIDGAYIEYKQK